VVLDDFSCSCFLVLALRDLLYVQSKRSSLETLLKCGYLHIGEYLMLFTIRQHLHHRRCFAIANAFHSPHRCSFSTAPLPLSTINVDSSDDASSGYNGFTDSWVNRTKPRVVILGSGWAGFTLARRLTKSSFDVRIISPANHFLFTPLLPSTAVGTLEFRAIQEPVRTIEGLDRYYQAKAQSLDLKGRVVKCEDAYRSVFLSFLVFTCCYISVCSAP